MTVNSIELLDAYPHLTQTLLNSQFLDIFPCALSIASDVSGVIILHNAIAAEFLRIEPCGSFVNSKPETHQAKVYHCGKPLAPEELPLQRACRGEIIDRFELEFVWEDGISKAAQGSARPLRDENGNICGALATMADVTDVVMKARRLEKQKTDLEKLIEERTVDLLRESKQRVEVIRDAERVKERFQAGIDLMPDGFGLFTPVQTGEGKVVDLIIDCVNDAHCKRARKSKAELMGHRLSELIENRQLLQAYCNVAETGQPLEQEPVYYSHDVHKTVDSAFKARAVKIDHGVAVFWHDVTEIKQNEDSLRLSEERFAKAFYSSPYMKSIITVADNRYLYVNDAFLQGYERTGEEVIGKTPLDLGARPEKMTEFLRLFKRDLMVRDLEVNINRKNGDHVVGLLSSVPIIIDGQDCILSEYYNITDLKRTQAEMARLDRLNLVGRMAAGIGHEIRNPMTTVRGYLQLLGEKQEYDGYKPAFELMISELDRANSILTEYLSLARNQMTKTVQQNLNHVLQNIFPLLEVNAVSQNKQIEFIQGEIPDIQMNVKEIHQLVLNLCQNGLDAMNEQAHLNLRTFVEGENVVLSVQDEGCGISSENLEKLGTPFFTTKDNGTGLGLATCYSIAARHKAHIKVETGPQGTTFSVRFPPTTEKD